jgi:hypothetical protein
MYSILNVQEHWGRKMDDDVTEETKARRLQRNCRLATKNMLGRDLRNLLGKQ